MDLGAVLDRERETVEAGLRGVLPAEGAWPGRLTEAMRYAVLGGGKRIRPILARLACGAMGGDPDAVTAAACGIELIHTYSLVHDDLPAMDDDNLRRGRPTVHVVYGEAMAILVGDALLTEGLRILALHPEGDAWSARRAEAVALVAEAAGATGMVGGQVEDLEATGAVDDGAHAARLDRIHAHKTGCLIRASLETGAVWAGAGREDRVRIAEWGRGLGLLFQIADDILDATATAEELGKSPGKDQAAGKLTYVTVYGLEVARKRMAELENRLVEEAAAIEGRDGTLAALASWVANRRR